MSLFWPKESAKCSQVIDICSDIDSIDEQLNKTIESHLFSRSIQLISTNSGLNSFTENYIRSTESLCYYLVKNIPIYVFINKLLFNGFVKTGRLSCLSINSEIDVKDCFTLLPNGLIVLSVKELTYHRLGIVGKKSILQRKKNCIKKYLIEIDLNDRHMTPGTKLYRRTEECLQKSGLLFDVFIKWEVTDEELTKRSISSNSLENFFSLIKSNSSDNCLDSLQWYRCLPSFNSFTNCYVPIPTVSEEFVSEDIQTLIEWFGAQMCQIDCEPNEDIEISTFGINCCQTREDVYCHTINGFFTSSDIKNFMNQLKQTVLKSKEEEEEEYITSIIVNGFEDSVISWMGKNNEHSKNLSGENLFGMASKKGLTFVWRTTDEYDFGIERL